MGISASMSVLSIDQLCITWKEYYLWFCLANILLNLYSMATLQIGLIQALIPLGLPFFRYSDNLEFKASMYKFWEKVFQELKGSQDL